MQSRVAIIIQHPTAQTLIAVDPDIATTTGFKTSVSVVILLGGIQKTLVLGLFRNRVAAFTA
jgi:hypothetical protein